MSIWRKKKRLHSLSVPSTILIVLGIAVLVTAVIFIRWKSDMEKHPTDKLEAYLEECLEEDVTISFDTFMYFTSYLSSDMIPYLGTVTLADSEQLTFCVEWMRGTSVDNGVYSEYDNNLVNHYAHKYGIEEHETPTWMEIHLTEDNLIGENASFSQFFNALRNSQYVQCGQELELYFESDIGHSVYLTMTINEPISYETIYNKLTEFQKN